MTVTIDTALPVNRAQQVRHVLDVALRHGSLAVLEGEVDDRVVDEVSTLRGLRPLISAWAAEHDMPTLVYDLKGGLTAFDAPGGPRGEVPAGVSGATPPTVALDVVIEALAGGGRATTFVLDHAEDLLRHDGGDGSHDSARLRQQVLALATDPVWRAQGHCVVLVAHHGSIDERVLRHPGVRTLRLGLPDASERGAALRLLVDSPTQPLLLAPDLPVEDAIHRTGGLRLDDLSRLRRETSAATPLTTGLLLQEKRDAIRGRAGTTLTLYEQDLDLDADVAGLPQVRRYLAERQAKQDYSLRLVLAGPPGNGKNWVARALARRLGVPAVELGRILGRYVGESEENLERAIAVIEAIAPVVVIMDEIDQGPLGRRGETHATDGAAVNANLRARLFGWLGDVGDRAGISVVGMTNRPDLLDGAAADRFTFIPVLHPTPFEAAQIMAIQARREGLDLDADAAALALAGSPRVFSGRQTVRLLDAAHTHALERGSRRIEGEDTSAAVSDALHEVGEAEHLQALLAIAYTTWNRHLPWNAARQLGDATAAPPAELAPYTAPDGTVRREALLARIDALRSRP